MDLRQIEYLIKIAEEKNITRAAEKLYISQPALNQQLLNLERELGTQLFVRQRKNWSLTEAGRIYVESGKRILEIKKEAYARISDLAQVKRDTLTVGVTPGAGDGMLAWVYKRFYETYPEIRLRVVKQNSYILKKELDEGRADFAILTVFEKENEDALCFEELKTEEMVLVMSEKHGMNGAVYEENGRPTVRLSDFKEEEFALGERKSMNGAIVEQAFERAGFAPKIFYLGGGFPMRMAMVEMNLCCSVIEEHHVKTIPDTVKAFYLDQHPRLHVAAAYRKDKYLSKAARDFIALAREYWKNW